MATVRGKSPPQKNLLQEFEDIVYKDPEWNTCYYKFWTIEKKQAFLWKLVARYSMSLARLNDRLYTASSGGASAQGCTPQDAIVRCYIKIRTTIVVKRLSRG